jgi:3-oxoacyl-[acyl-carrier-protein] synthase-3
MTKIRAAITGVMGYVPEDVLSNQDLEKLVDTNDEWILSRTGISERRIQKGEGLGVTDIALPAVKGLLEKTGTKPEEIELLIFCTVTPDMVFPASANILCDKAGLTNAWGYDLGAACSGFLFGLNTASKFIESGAHKKVIVVGADKMSSIIDYTDRATCVIFGDGGGAVLLEPTTEECGVMDAMLFTDGSGRTFLHQKAGGSVKPASHESVDAKEHFVYQEGKQVFRFAVTNMAEAAAKVMERNKLNADDIKWLVPHQANLRIIDATAERMGVGREKVMINIQKFGNTTNGTLPLCLWEWEKQLKKGDNLILAAFGGGFTWGAIWLKWAYNS